MGAPEAEPAAAARVPGARAALGFALAAAAASWNPFAAPFGLVVGIAASVLAWRALRRAGARRRIPAAALGLGLVAAIASAAVLAVTAGSVGADLPGQPVLKARTTEELDRTLAEAAARTRAERERARAELQRFGGTAREGGGAPPAAPDGGPEALAPDAR
ncbi:hypothetical protein [Anaeromyxobacter diazotrophicus]|uniref:Uncharacterized protein n=1 Tax=Anaeromyxobacter diazotrophicus TaxID=2590199 RepID=A0A7I9VPD7_9BACT|nr:hypothetical protein [Anaeromyxobacter diazotrophicus]GEJ58273.1 hypothetical protein AMYX_30140 [Anaeromyxobacter diazotrophicus]